MGALTWKFNNKVAVITGAAGGIGGQLANLLAEAGAHVVLADLDISGVEKRASDLTYRGFHATAYELNASNPISIDSLIENIRASFGRIDLLVPSAGIYPESLIRDMPDEQWDNVQSINLTGVFMLVKRAIPIMPPGSSIVTLTSVAGHRGSRGHGHYAASKGGLIAFTRTLAIELGQHQIRVNGVSPGIVETAMTAEARETHGDAWVSSTPLGRNGTSLEIANVIAFLLSDSASFVHGEIVHVNGGLFMAG